MKKIRIGFFKKPQGIFTPELIKAITSELKSFPNIELFTDLDFRKAHVKNGHAYIEDFDLNTLDIYFWHDTIKPTDWGSDNYALNVLRALENNCLVINSSESTRIVNDKYLAHTTLKRANLPVADFALVTASDKAALQKVFTDFNSAVLIKPRFGGWGAGIIKISSLNDLFDQVELLLSFTSNQNQQILLEKYYPNDLSKWISVVVLGDKILFGYKKSIMRESDWKICDPDKKDGRGLFSEYINPPNHLKEIALHAKRAIGKDIICFDFIHTQDGYKIVDENGRPGLYAHCLKKANIDIKKEIINLILSKIEK
ncbi:MAG: hypothetical protein WC823_01040 [Parcubacteria group bacterium]|jgi:glutathione synthase/RimK-type ligase-like ATP-grasp enzyme